MNDIRRTVVVVSPTAALSDILREVITPQQARVYRTTAGEAARDIGSFRPWPFAIATDDPEAVPLVAELCADKPILVFWHGDSVPGLPAHVIGTPDWRDLLDRIQSALCNEVGGIRLAIYRGVVTEDGKYGYAPKLEPLIAMYPHPLTVSWRGTSDVNRVLARLDATVRVDRQAGTAVLKPVPQGLPA